MIVAVIFPKDSEALFNVNSNRTFGGASVQLFNIVKEISKNIKLNIISVIPNYKTINFKDKSDFNFYKTYNEKDNVIIKYIKFNRTIKNIKPEIILQRGLTLLSCFLAVYLHLIKIKYVFMFAHDVETSGCYQNSRKKCFFFRLLVKFSSLLIVQNQIQRNNLLKYVKNDKQIKILRKGIEIDSINPDSKKRKYYSAIWIGRCEPWKNIEAFIRLAEKNPGEKFMIISSPVPKKKGYFNDIKNKIERLNNTFFYESLSNNKVHTLLLESGVFCITSDSEGDWPMTVLEAAACGLPILSLNFDYGGMLEEYKAGFYCNGSEQLLNQYFDKLLRDKKLYNKFSKRSKKYIEENYSIRKNSQILISYLTSL